MDKAILCVAVVCLCFGQSIWLKENPKITLPIGVSTKSAYPPNEVGIDKHARYSSNSISPLNNLQYPLLLQVEGESLQPKTSPWKIVASYGSEYVAGTISSAFIYCIVYIEFYRAGVEYEPWQHPIKFFLINKAGDMVMSTSLIWGIGKLWGKKGSIIKTAIGVGAGTLIGSSVEYIWDKCGDGRTVPRFVIPFTSSLGGVIGFNLR